MKICGIIAEYNPFHLGHIKQIKYAKKELGAEKVVAILSGNFTERGEPAVFGLGQVIKGWTEGLQLMAEGAKYELYLPYQLAYGEHGAGSAIPPYSALKFVVELLEVL